MVPTGAGRHHEVRPDLLTPAEVAELLRVSKRTVLRWVETGELRAFRFGPRLLRIPRSEVERFLRKAQE